MKDMMRRSAIAKRAMFSIAACVLLTVPLVYLQNRSGNSKAAQASTEQTEPTPEQQLKHWADKTAAPLLEELNQTPENTRLAVKIGNIYCDAHQFAQCIQFYERGLKLKESADVRTDLANAFYYSGDSDRAISELVKVLRYQPNHANALFNLGMIRWQAKQDSEGAVLAWQELLRAHPSFPLRKQVEQLIAKAGSPVPSAGSIPSH